MEEAERAMKNFSDLIAVEVIRSKFMGDVDMWWYQQFQSSCSKTLLMIASKQGLIECCRFLLSVDPGAINFQNSNGFTALHYAAYNGHEDVSLLLLNSGANPQLRNNYNEDAVDSAFAGYHVELALKLKRSDLAKLSQQSTDKEVATYSSFQPVIIDHTSSLTLKSSKDKRKSESDINLTQTKSIEEGEILEENQTPIEQLHKENQRIYYEQPQVSFSAAVSEALQCARITRAEAANFYLLISSSGDGGDQSQVGEEYCCVASDPCYTKSVPDANSSSNKEQKATSEIVRSSASKDDLTIGRSRQNHIVINDLSISKQHAVISYFDDLGFYVRDLGSKHGTFVDGIQISNAEIGRREEHRLRDGMEIKFGRIVCKVVRKRQAAVLSGSFQPNQKFGQQLLAVVQLDQHVKDSFIKRQATEDRKLAGQKRKASVASEWCADVHTQNSGTGTGNGVLQMAAVTSHAVSSSSSQQRDTAAALAENDKSGESQYQRPISEVGSSLLQKLGWTEGEKLGKSGGDADAPIEVLKRRDRVGLGCANALDTDAHTDSSSSLTSAKARLLQKTMERYNGLL